MREPRSAASLAKSKAAHISWAKTPDWAARTAAGRKAADARFLALAGGDPKRAASLRKAHYADIQRKSIAARQAKAKKTARQGRQVQALGGDAVSA